MIDPPCQTIIINNDHGAMDILISFWQDFDRVVNACDRFRHGYGQFRTGPTGRVKKQFKDHPHARPPTIDLIALYVAAQVAMCRARTTPRWL
jgi:hypothetical protein